MCILLALALENFNPLDDANGTFELLLRVYLKSFQGHLSVYEEIWAITEKFSSYTSYQAHASGLEFLLFILYTLYLENLVKEQI